MLRGEADAGSRLSAAESIHDLNRVGGREPSAVLTLPAEGERRPDTVIVGVSRRSTLLRILHDGRSPGATFVVERATREWTLPTHGTPAGADAGGLLLRSGGTTGAPRWSRIDIRPRIMQAFALNLRDAGWSSGMRQLSVLPLYHSAGLTTAVAGVESGNPLFLLERFSSRAFVRAVIENDIDWVCLTPAHMAILRRDGALDVLGRNSSLRVLHTAGPCSPGLKRSWLSALGPDRVSEMYSSSEQAGMTLVTGHEWLDRPGTAGRGRMTTITIMAPTGEEATPGEIGHVHLSTFTAQSRARRGESVDVGTTFGDRGYLDEDGYLFLTGRYQPSVNVGGELVDLDDVREALLRIPGVENVAIQPIADEMLGAVIGAVIQAGVSVTRASISRALRRDLPAAAKPRRIVFVDEWPTDARGKTSASLVQSLLAKENPC